LKSNWAFDQKAYEQLNKAREAVVRDLIAQLKVVLPFATAVDIGCGVGHFSNVLDSLGLNVLGLDAREQNVLEARRRYPHIRFEVMNVEDLRLLQFGQFDLVFCFGLLYHLENPFQSIRNMSSMTTQVALLEGVCYPSRESMMVLVDEDDLDDQGVNNIAFYPTETCLIKMLFRSGYTYCFLPRSMPDHPFYNPPEGPFRYRTLLVASKHPLKLASLIPQAVPISELRAWHLVPMRTVGKRASKLLDFLETIARPKRTAMRTQHSASPKGEK
jgi:SAM-dependent methyltransferase